MIFNIENFIFCYEGSLMQKCFFIFLVFLSSCSKIYLEETKNVIPINAKVSYADRTDGVLIQWSTYWEFNHYAILRADVSETLSYNNTSAMIRNNLIKDSYLDQSAVSGKNIYYVVIAFNNDNKIIGRSEVLVGKRNLPLLTSSNPPANIEVSDREFTDRIEIFWVSANNDSITRIYRSSNNTEFIAIADVEGNSYIDTNVFPYITYKYKLAHVGVDQNNNFQEYFSGEYTGTIISYPKNIEASQYYTGNDGSGVGTILIQWDKDLNVDTYRIYRSTDDVNFTVIAPSVQQNYFVDFNLPNIVGNFSPDDLFPKYYYRIQSIKNGVGSTISDSYIGIAIPPNQELPKPSSISVKKSGFISITYTLSWAAVDGATAYRVYRKNASQEDWFDVKDYTATSVKYAASSDSLIVDTPAGTDMIFEVRAIKNGHPVGIPTNTSISKS